MSEAAAIPNVVEGSDWASTSHQTPRQMTDKEKAARLWLEVLMNDALTLY